MANFRVDMIGPAGQDHHPFPMGTGKGQGPVALGTDIRHISTVGAIACLNGGLYLLGPNIREEVV